MPDIPMPDPPEMVCVDCHIPADLRYLDGDNRCPSCATNARYPNRCTHCFSRYSDATRANECCRYACPMCGTRWNVRSDAENCCNYYSCSSCGEEWSTESQANACCREYNDSPESSDLIHGYSYRPLPQFHGDGPLYLGMELEMCTNGYLDSAAETAVRTLGTLAYLKEDGSVPGFEMVTHPMSYAYAMERFPWRLLPELEREGCSTDEETGLHIHVSRAAFSGPCHIFRWHKLIYRNAGPVQALARRANSTWAQFGTERYDSEPIAKGMAQSTSRYAAINAQNAETFELRMFQASLNPPDVQACLAFADASVRYTQTLTSADVLKGAGWTWEAFTAWVAERAQYAPLTAALPSLSWQDSPPVRRTHDSYRCRGCYHCRMRRLRQEANRAATQRRLTESRTTSPVPPEWWSEFTRITEERNTF